MGETYSGAKFQSSYADVAHRASPLADFLSYLAFEGQSARFALELFLCLSLHQILYFVIPWGNFSIAVYWQPFISWFMACAITGVFDFAICVKPLRCLQGALRLSANGNFEAALQTLLALHPKSKKLVRLSAPRYYFTRAKIFLNSGNLESAEMALVEAGQSSERIDHICVLRSEIAALRGNIERALAEIQLAESLVGQTAELLLQQGRLLFHFSKDFQSAKRSFERALHVAQNSLPSFNRQEELLMHGYYATSLLWTGRAEEGLEALNKILSYLGPTPFLEQSMSDHLSALYLERAFYAATHKEPELAIEDIKRASFLGLSPLRQQRLVQISDELSWRHPKAVPV